MTTVHIVLPDQLAQEAQRAGLLTPATLERWLREQLDARQIEGLFAAMDKMAAVEEPAVMSPEDLADEVARLKTEGAASRQD
ncbi:hypothetical protein [uncultured Aquincola sp.]|uniref:hypothetical protein n=1 Tax=uncultured Aquincola sp. TaxID=886556 RepID=UPI0032B295DF|tara:strand:- start:664 stop:909 length:246 start_codon:yes stop_codon:yes gene_type:complete